MNSNSVQVGKIYRHFKGNLYKVLNIAKCSETLNEFVVYETLYENPEGRIWIRPLTMFQEKIEKDGKTISRFTLVESLSES